MVVIAVSGPPSAGTSTVARGLAQRLKLGYWSPGQYLKNLAKEQVSGESKKALSVISTEEGQSKDLHEKIDDMQLKKAGEGDVVIDGKLSIHMLKDVADYKVWVNVDLEVRASRLVERDGSLPYDEVLKTLREREKIERKMWKDIYGFDYFEQEKEADIVINSSNMNAEETVDAILEMVDVKKQK